MQLLSQLLMSVAALEHTFSCLPSSTGIGITTELCPWGPVVISSALWCDLGNPLKVLVCFNTVLWQRAVSKYKIKDWLENSLSCLRDTEHLAGKWRLSPCSCVHSSASPLHSKHPDHDTSTSGKPDSWVLHYPSQIVFSRNCQQVSLSADSDTNTLFSLENSNWNPSVLSMRLV